MSFIFHQVHSQRMTNASYQLQYPLANRTRSVAWVANNCEKPGKRERYVKELQRYIDVDIYGSCGNATLCSANETDFDACFEQKIPLEYKFYLAFEENFCQDYVTDRLYRGLKAEVVPVVYGGGAYFRDVPRRALIDVAKYPSPKDLAQYLNQLGSNEVEYTAYFQWKARYRITRDVMPTALCKLCRIANMPEFHNTYEDIGRWFSDGKCRCIM